MRKRRQQSSFVNRLTDYKYLLGLLGVVIAGIVFYANSPIFPLKLLALLFVVSALVILFLPSKTEYATVLIILVFGGLSAVLSPINDIPDEYVHFARSSFLSDGHLNLSNNKEHLKISEDVLHVEEMQTQSLFNHSDETEHSEKTVTYPLLSQTNAYYNVSYLPQALGLKIGELLGFDVLTIYFIGRLFNVLAYALLIFFAVKLAADLGQVVGIVSLLPMNIYLSGSFNQDVVANGLLFLTISLFFNSLQADKISIGRYLLYIGLVAMITFVKLPYILLIGLPFFIPLAKIDLSPMKAVTLKVFSVIVILGIGLVWFKLYGQIKSPLYENVDFLKAVNPGGQIRAIIAEPLRYIIAIFNNISAYLLELDSTNTFGQLTYGISNLSSLLMLFYFTLVMNNANVIQMSKWTKLGIFLVCLGIASGISLALLLTWTPVGSYTVLGVQGRYFIGLYPLIIVFFAANNRLFERCRGMIAEKTMFVTALYFIVFMLISTLFKYYIS